MWFKKKIKEIDELFNGYFIPVVATLSTIICMVVYVVIIIKIFLFSFWAGCLFVIIPSLIIWSIIHVLVKRDKKLKEKLCLDIENDNNKEKENKKWFGNPWFGNPLDGSIGCDGNSGGDGGGGS